MKLHTPGDYAVRPTADRVKEAIFSIIGTKICSAAVLDLFAGTGNLGLEAWSRGADRITFVDDSSKSLALVRANIKKTRAEAETAVIKKSAEKAIRQLCTAGEYFDFVFCDPPYRLGWVDKIIKALAEFPVFTTGGYLVIEQSAEEALPETTDDWENIRSVVYGETAVVFLRWQGR